MRYLLYILAAIPMFSGLLVFVATLKELRSFRND